MECACVHIVKNITDCILPNNTIPNCTLSNTTNSNASDLPNWDEVGRYYVFESYVRIIIPVIFGLIVALGLLGNLLVIVVIIINQQMRSTTNLLILNLAIADLCFIVFCVPFTATGYAIPIWPFGVVWCKIVQYMTYVCAYASVYTLVTMSLDRYLAVVHPISSMSIRNQTNTVRILIVLWLIILGGNSPLLHNHVVFEYDYYGELRATCISKYSVSKNIRMQKVFYGTFFFFGYLLPLSLTCVLYGLMLKRLLYGVAPGGNRRAESSRSKKRVTKMVVIVVAIFAVCWLPIQVIFMLQHFGYYPENFTNIAFQMVSNCLAYMNSCVNPILYAFLSDNFRKSFRKLLCCGERSYAKFEYERTNTRADRADKPPVNCTSNGKNYSLTSTTTTTVLQSYNNHSEEKGESVNHCTQTDV